MHHCYTYLFINTRHQFNIFCSFPEVSAMYVQRSAESLMRRARKSSLPLIPDTLRQLGDLFEQGDLNRYQVNDEIIYKGIFEYIVTKCTSS